MEKFIETIKNFCFKISDSLDNISEKIFEQTGFKINFKIIIGILILVICVIILVKSVLGWVHGALLG